MTIKDYKKSKRFSSTNTENKEKAKYIHDLIKRTLITIILVMLTLIACNYSKKAKTYINKYLFETNFNFSYLNQLYDKVMINFKGNKKNESPVNKPIDEIKIETYMDGAIIEIDGEESLKLLESGIVVFIGEKDNYGNVIIVQQSNGIDAWYGNIVTTDIKLYDYVEKGAIIGKVEDNYYLIFQKNGEFLDYKEFIK